MRLPPTLLLLAALLGLSQCKKSHPDPAKPEDQLPPATQTGANTFGCLVNGQPWLPSGNNGTPNSVALYDKYPNGADLNIATYRIAGREEYINLFCGFITPQKRTFIISLPPKTEATGHYDGFYGDYSHDYSLNYVKGQIALTRMDEAAGIVAGTFWFTAVRIGSSDTLKVTQGRFDYKF